MNQYLAVVMKHNKAAAVAGRVNTWLLPLLAFCLPLSTSVTTVLAMLIFLAWAVEGQYGSKVAEMTGNSVCVAVLGFLALQAVGLLWTDDKGAGLAMAGRYWKLLLMPVFLTAAAHGHRRRIIFFYLAGLSAVMLATYLAWFDVWHPGGVTPEHPTRKVFHVVYNPMLAFGFYLAMHEVLWGAAARPWKWLLGGISLAMAWNMFITEGRAGQAGFFLLTALLVLQYYRKNILAGLAIAALLLPLLFAGAYSLSPTFQARMEAVMQEISSFGRDPATSIGMRLMFWQNSWRIIRENPLIGVGTGDFTREYARVNAVHSPDMPVTDNPHNQYILVLCQLGLAGLAALAAVFLLQVRQALKTSDGLQRLRLALPFLFLAIMMTESYLIVFETGFLFSLFSGVLYKTGADE
jgi:O-antigen ligase